MKDNAIDLTFKQLNLLLFFIRLGESIVNIDLQTGGEISVIIVTDDYLCYKEPKSPYNFISYFNI